MRIILAEDTALLRDGLTSVLERFGHVVTSVADAVELEAVVEIALSSSTGVDIVITDIRMPPHHRNDGLEAAIALRARHPGLPVLVLSQYVAGAYARELLADGGGGVGYLLKDRVGRIADFLSSLAVVRAGGTVIDPEVVQQVFARTAPGSPLAALTSREREVLEKMASGMANGDIADALVVSEAAVAKHIGSIFLKLGLSAEDPGHRRVRAVLAFLSADVR
ncbi:response regulator [Rathayibacter rathayi]|uniref:response regulator n=1 Tax=Rathayibacter rathayi TaxID=33887 RepID=UPI001C66DA58|nr:response regulator transcription factor [Rathayibacter rathayi]